MNFNSPYKATSIQEFWRRWHITLSRFLKEYIYIPLGGNRKSEIRTYTNLFITFVLGGIWHGAGWTFVLWGMLHGLALIIHRVWQKFSIRLPSIIAWFLTFNFLNITWVFFRANSFEDALKVLKGMFSGALILPPELYTISWIKASGVHFGVWSNIFATHRYLGLWLVGGLFIVLFLPNSMEWMKRFKTNLFYLLFTVLGFLSIFMLYKKSEFLYFNF